LSLFLGQIRILVSLTNPFEQSMEDSKPYQELRNTISRLEKELASAKAESSGLKRSFLSGISHELRTPMHAILGFSELLANLNLSNEEKEEYALYIQECGTSLMGMIDAMIDAALIEQDNMNLNTEACCLDEMMHELYIYARNQKHMQEKYAIALLLNIPANHEESLIKTDKQRLIQVIMGLLNNALKYTPKGIIEFGYQLMNEKVIRFYVADSGNGGLVKAGNLIFENGNAMDQHWPQGKFQNGFGLGILKGIIEKMGGNIWVEPNNFNGSTFLFNVPYYPAGNMKGLQFTLNPDFKKGQQFMD
jgi:signal transduction histidine kinase